MKKIVNASILVSVLAAGLAFAVGASGVARDPRAVGDFSGHWTADKGTVSSNLGLRSDCTKVELDIAQTADKLTVRKYKSDCNLFGSSWGPDEMTLKDGKVYEDGDEVGTITGDTLMTIAPSGTVAYAFNLKLVKGADGQPVLESYYGVKNATGAIATEANLTKAAP